MDVSFVELVADTAFGVVKHVEPISVVPSPVLVDGVAYSDVVGLMALVNYNQHLDTA